MGPTGTARRRRDLRTSRRGWVRTSQDGAVLTVTLDRPDQLNAQTPATWSALAEIGASLPDDVRVVVVRGAGRAFSAGLDRSLFSPEPGVESGLGDVGRMPDGGGAGADPRVPGRLPVAALAGHRLDRGRAGARASAPAPSSRSPATCASSPRTPQLRLPEATLGLVPDLTGTSTLVELVGYSRALEICLTGRAVRAAEARAIGLANLVVDAADLDATVADLVAALTAPPVGGQPGDRGPGALRRPQRPRRRRTPPSGPPRCAGCRELVGGR